MVTIRIKILAGGFGGSVSDMQSGVNRLYSNIENTIDDLKSLRKQIREVNGGTHNLGNAVDGISRRIQVEEAKKVNLETVSQKINTFLSNAISTDSQVARDVRQNQKNFYNDFPWLRPQDINQKPSIWEQLASAWSDFWGKAGEWISDLVGNIIEYIKEHAVELIVGLVCIVVGAVLTWLTGGAFLAALAALLKAVVIQAAIGAAISGTIALFTGGNFWEAVGDGFAQGFMWGGIFSTISTAITAIRGAIQGLKYADDVVNVADDVVNSADDVANVADDVINNADDVANAADDIINSADDMANAADDVINNADDVANVADDVASAPKKYPQEVLDELTDIDNFDDDAIEHIYKGQRRGTKSSGGHYEGLEGEHFQIVEGTRSPPGQHNVYTADIIVDGATRSKMSSFFPQEWSPQQVVNKINEVYSKLSIPKGHTGLVSGFTDEGMKIEMYLINGKIHTAYPKYFP